MKALYCVPFANGAPTLPPVYAAEKGALQLAYEPAEGQVVHGGYTIKSYCPDDTVIVLVDATEATHTAMKADPTYLWLEDIADAE